MCDSCFSVVFFCAASLACLPNTKPQKTTSKRILAPRYNVQPSIKTKRCHSGQLMVTTMASEDEAHQRAPSSERQPMDVEEEEGEDWQSLHHDLTSSKFVAHLKGKLRGVADQATRALHTNMAPLASHQALSKMLNTLDVVYEAGGTLPSVQV